MSLLRQPRYDRGLRRQADRGRGDSPHGRRSETLLRAPRRHHLLGREPTFQAAGLVPLVRSLKEAGIHVCLDSNGGVWNPAVEELLGLVDLVLLDVKQASPERHRVLTGRDNTQTLRTAAWLEEHAKPFWLRYVLVPGYSDAKEDIRALGERLGGYRMIERVELLPYHTLGVHKYEAMGLEYRLRDVRENTPEQLDRAASLLREYFASVIIN